MPAEGVDEIVAVAAGDIVSAGFGDLRGANVGLADANGVAVARGLTD